MSDELEQRALEGTLLSPTAPSKYNWGTGKDRVIPGCEDFIHLETLEGMGGYEWAQMDIFYSPSRRRFFWIDQDGCSCDGPWHEVDSIEDFNSGNKQDALNAIREYKSTWIGDESGSLTEENVNRAISAVRSTNN